ncbi:MAG: DUF58 domain-containing protein, partial [Planctomycetes bacterium]|nr:DUF58 domain-containing protein [Planctomycetota bacterium]
LLLTVQQQVIERLGRVGVAARQAVESVLVGQHRSLRRGLSVEFAGHRPYQPGDDLRRLDWTVYARSDRFDVRQYEEETRLRATLIVDCSGSMAYGSRGGTKLDYARQLAAALGFLMVRQADAVGLATCDTAVREHLPPAGTMAHLMNALDRLEATVAGGETSLGAVITELAGRISRRGLVVLISDCFDDPDRLLMALRLLRHRRQDVRVYQIVDPAEDEFPHQGVVEFIGLEHEPRLRLDADRVRAWYREAMVTHRRRLAEGCHAMQVQFETARTDEDLASVLVRSLTGQRAGR